MSSDNEYERAFKLWISLWNLVLESRRHLEGVCATLQALVFEKTTWPEFKNWPAICELGKKDHLMMIVVATLNLTKRDPYVDRVIAAFPECFSNTYLTGPIPWSILVQDSFDSILARGKDAETASMGKFFLECTGTLKKYNIPYQEFWFDESFIDQNDRRRGILPLPENIDAAVAVGTCVKWLGKDYVVVENRQTGDPNDDICIAPAGCVDMTL